MLSNPSDPTSSDHEQTESEPSPATHPQIASNYPKCTSINSVKKYFPQDVDEIKSEEEKNEKFFVVEKSPTGRFHRFNNELGSGAQKKVYMCYDSDNGRQCAWNVINIGIMTDDAIIKIREEINIMKKLKHPNVISFISGFYNDEKKELVVITEIFNGGTLKKHIAKFGQPRLRVIKKWCVEILKGLKYLHELPNPIIHRDIKCDNIFIDKYNGRVKIGDLGLSCVLKSNDYAKSFNGTVEFCAPEVFYGKYGVKADVYSFGMTVLEMITGERPYKECDGNIISICDNSTKGKMPLSLKKIRNARLKEFIEMCLRKEENRPDTNELLESKFLNDLESEENNYPALDYPVIPRNSSSISPARKKHFNNLINSNQIINLNSVKKQKPKEITLELKEEKSNGDNITMLLKHMNINSSKSYNIEFVFNLTKDTVEGVVREMTKEINLSKKDSEEIEKKMRELVNEHLNKDKKAFLEYYDKFNIKLQKILKEAEDIITYSKQIKELPQKEAKTYNNKVHLLEQFIDIQKNN